MRTRRTYWITLLALVFTSLLWLNDNLGAQAWMSELATRPLSAILDWYYIDTSDNATGIELGYSVHTAGDVNADGYDDILVGIPKYSPPEIERSGRVLAFYGGPYGLSTDPDWIMDGFLKGAHFGNSVSTAGDVNGDGFDDVIIGADEYKLVFDGVSGEPKSGKVFVFYGSADGLLEVSTWYIQAEAPSIALGWAVSTAGDVNNDGYDDILISAPMYSGSDDQSSEGKIYLYLGSSAGLSATPDWTYECDQPAAQCGYSLDSAGDVNHDGYDDVIIGTGYWNGTQIDEGAAMVFLGSELGLEPVPSWFVEGGQASAQFGYSVAGTGDVNGDSYDDLLVGAPSYSQYPGIDDRVGAVFLFYGSSEGPGLVPDWISYGEEPYSRYGHALHTAGDVDGNGYADFIIGAYLMGTSGDVVHQPDEGAIYVYTGGYFGPGNRPDWSTYGDKADAWFGYSLGTAGDVDGDQMDDILVGTPNYKIDEKDVVGKAFGFYSLETSPRNTVFIPLIVSAPGE